MKVTVSIVLLLASFAGALPSQPCSILNYAIICSGHQVNDDSLLKLIEQIKIGYAHMHFAQLIITETEITHIPADAFSDCTFESILVEGNAHLSTVHEQSFSVQQHCKSLVIINNALLTDNNIFKLVRQMNLLEDVDFEFNHLNVSVVTTILGAHNVCCTRKYHPMPLEWKQSIMKGKAWNMTDQTTINLKCLTES